jgi:hypothetical protein
MKFKITYLKKSIIGVTALAMLMCWASQSSAQPTRAKATASAPLYATVGVCDVASTNIHNQPAKGSPTGSDENYQSTYGFYSIVTVAEEASYAFEYHNEPYAMPNDYEAWTSAVENAEIKILVLPKHGKLMLQNGGNGQYDIAPPPVGQYTADTSLSFGYKPDSNYIGTDTIVFMVKMTGKEIKVVRYIKVTDKELTKRDTFDNYKDYCGKKWLWKISTTQEGAPTISSLDSPRRLG